MVLEGFQEEMSFQLNFEGVKFIKVKCERQGREYSIRQSIEVSTSIVCIGFKANFIRAYVSMGKRVLGPEVLNRVRI